MDTPNYVPYTCYVAIDEDNNIIGVGSLRHKLNDYLLNLGGHIGYSVISSERRKEYETKILELLLEEAKKKSINKVLVTCKEDNLGSAGVIKNNNSVLENKISHNNQVTCRYWIENL